MKKLLAHLVLVGAVSASTLAFGGEISITGGATKSVVGSQDEVYYEWTDTANPGTITIPEGASLLTSSSLAVAARADSAARAVVAAVV